MDWTVFNCVRKSYSTFFVLLVDNLFSGLFYTFLDAMKRFWADHSGLFIDFWIFTQQQLFFETSWFFVWWHWCSFIFSYVCVNISEHLNFLCYRSHLLILSRLCDTLLSLNYAILCLFFLKWFKEYMRLLCLLEILNFAAIIFNFLAGTENPIITRRACDSIWISLQDWALIK